mgnify:FL=1
MVREDALSNGISVILADDERRSQPRRPLKHAPAREQVLFWLRRRTMCAVDLAAKLGIENVDTLRTTLTRMRIDRQIYVVYRRIVEHEIDGAGRRRHLVSYYRARVR